MSDDTKQQGAADRSQVATGEGYELRYFANKHGLTQDAARALISEMGNDRDKLDAAASKASDKGRSKRMGTARDRASGSGSTSSAGSAAGPAARRAADGANAPARKTVVPETSAVAAPTSSVVHAPAARPRVSVASKRRMDTPSSDARTSLRRAKTALATARRSSVSGRHRAAGVPAVVGDRVSRAVDATKAAATGRTAALIGAAAAGIAAGLAMNFMRKTIVQAPGVMAGDWFEALKAEHRLALSIFDEIAQTTEAETAKRSTLLVQLKHALGKHAFTEESVIYPALRDWGDKADADKLNHDHGYVKQSLHELDALEKCSPAYFARVAVFRADLEAHIREEEEAIFPQLHAAMGASKNADITALANKEALRLA